MLIFFDDIMIYSRTIEDHIIHLRFAFEEMVKHQLLSKMSRCFFGVHITEYLGHFITTIGISIDPQKIEAPTWPTPTTVK